MTSQRALATFWEKADGGFFAKWRDRMAHIRKPYAGECMEEFRTLGWHDIKRRRILLTRVDFERKPLPDNKVLKIPFLAFADETIEDRDDVLLPIIEQIMRSEVGMLQ